MHDIVLIATDGSEEAERAVNYGVDLAEAFDAEVHALYVVETQATYILTVGLSDDEMQEYEEYGEDVVTQVVEKASDNGLDGTGVVKTGDVAEEVVEYAEDHGVGTIVLGQQGRNSTLDKYIGGTPEKVMKMTDIPVVAIGPESS